MSDDLIRRGDVEAAIRARQSITQDPMIYAGLSVALQELAALPADPAPVAAPAPNIKCDYCLGYREVQKMVPCPKCRGKT